MRIVAYVPDLMDRSKVTAAGGALGAEIEMVTDPAALAPAAEGADVVVIDLGRPGVLDALADLAGAPTVGFASHVDAELLRSAKRAGCGRVLARSAFFGNLAEVLAAPGLRRQPGPGEGSAAPG
ncbi:MAG TPA: hypothetical protein VG184_03600 [Acidimicrobiales bacterium]|nr:hypothetical protein [Acidimicrobiales bacterium]